MIPPETERWFADRMKPKKTIALQSEPRIARLAW
jgi:hypothetical protein